MLCGVDPKDVGVWNTVDRLYPDFVEAYHADHVQTLCWGCNKDKAWLPQWSWLELIVTIIIAHG